MSMEPIASICMGIAKISGIHNDAILVFILIALYAVAVVLPFIEKTATDLIAILLSVLGMPITFPVFLFALIKMAKRYPRQVKQGVATAVAGASVKAEAEEDDGLLFYHALKKTSYSVKCDLSPETMNKNRGASYWDILQDREHCYPLVIETKDAPTYVAPIFVMPDEKIIFVAAYLITDDGKIDDETVFFLATTKQNPYNIVLVDRDEHKDVFEEISRVFLEMTSWGADEKSDEKGESSLHEMLLSENCENVFLEGPDGSKREFEQICTVPLGDDVYCILKPVEPMENVAEDEAIVFKLAISEEGEETLLVADCEVAKAVFEEYYRLLDEAEENN